MRKILKYLTIYLGVSIIVLYSIAFAIDLSGWSDDAYKRLRSSNEKSLIIGTSRAAQGIHPNIIDNKMKNLDYYLPIYNFSFTLTASPYGEVYYKAIKKKLSKNNYSNGLFILSVDPLGLSMEENILDKKQLRENKQCLSGVNIYMHPNIFYLWKYAKRPLKFKNHKMILNDNGWLEINVPMDSASLNKRISQKKKDYSSYNFKKSDYRLKWLSKTISYLKQRGTVILVRIPSSIFMREYENTIWPEFEKDIAIRAKVENVEYISFVNKYGDYRTTDGNHLYKEDGAIFTSELCDSIKSRLKISK